ncbi:DNA polymerase II [Vibrio europaeus]|uniref:DNA polymerase n=1 Tax=Vibrio europaeus TaxID=300876 RepID=A0A178JDU3_9VIBR|nr:DNA polymerase II [Vibrio europaeus]MDC5707568.1 DNA polymerase II [Vibrio europaeus]MDC5709814.1 DNA polymerase II [Vibrio europaeus]MDC5716709.1 DNA polymerase II [Vibrio europaeus]MDC5722670.1 DNA polymerase II [Vibrio europaeus]MDC5727029.1 DNA polymerase II [Vibrio europaeus]
MAIQNGFVLTRQARDIKGTTQIDLWLSTPQGPTQLLIEGEKTVFFVFQDQLERAKAQTQNLQIEWKTLPLKDFALRPVAACYCHSIKQAQSLSDHLKQQEIVVLEDDIRLADRYLMERFIQGSLEFTGVVQNNVSHLRFKQVKCRQGDYTPELKVVSLDIECSEKGVLYSIGLDSPMDSRVIMIGAPQPADTDIQWVSNEKELLLALVDWFNQFDPDVIVGWNVIDFDFRLLHKRAERNQVKLMLGRGKQSSFFRTSNTTQQAFISIPGRVVMDGIDTLKTATYHFRSWSLEAVSQELLGEGKQIHNVHDRMDEINQMYRHDKPSLAKYNLQDCVLVNKIFAHTHLLEFAIERSKLTGVELDRVGGSVAAFTNLYLPQIHRAGYVAPNLHPENWLASPGGYVMDSIPNLYDSVLVLDFKSLYPSIIRSFLIDPMGLIEGLQQDIGLEQEQAVPGFRGGQFHRTRHFLPEMIENLWAARDVAKKNNEKAFSQAIKIIMNSFYGVLGSSGCRFFDTRLASSITMRGHEIMKQTKVLIEEKGYQVIYGDTDSTFVSLNGQFSQSQADDVGHQLVDYINEWWTNHLHEEYNLNSILELEYETHYKKFLMPTIRGQETGSKKRYAGLIGEGDSERLIFKGLESARTDWTPLAQEFQQTLYSMVFHGENPSDYIRGFVEQTKAGDFDDKLVYQKRLRRKLHEYQKNIPPQVRAARMADEINGQLGRPLQYQNKGRIEYVITTSGPEPKEYQKSAIDYQHYIDKQLKPVAEAILPFIGLDFATLSEPQLGLF